MRFTAGLFEPPALRPAAMSSLARFSIHLVAVVSAGPPEGGLYLKPPSSGGVGEGGMTMPSARFSLRFLLRARMAWVGSGVGGWPGWFGVWIAAGLLVRWCASWFLSLPLCGPLYGMRVAGGNEWGFEMIRKWQGKMLVFWVRLA